MGTILLQARRIAEFSFLAAMLGVLTDNAAMIPMSPHQSS
jgi:hypothetical protein